MSDISVPHNSELTRQPRVSATSEVEHEEHLIFSKNISPTVFLQGHNTDEVSMIEMLF